MKTFLFLASLIATVFTQAQKYFGHEYVDLGLPSGKLWAKTDLGATSETVSGEKFAWGETSSKTKFEWMTYELSDKGWGNIAYFYLKKYITNDIYGTKDNKKKLQPMDDAARQNWNGEWKMPTQSDFQELVTYCNFERDWLNNCYKVTSNKNGNSLFLASDEYWTSEIEDTDYPNYAAVFYVSAQSLYDDERCFGKSIRPVVDKTAIAVNEEESAEETDAPTALAKVKSEISSGTIYDLSGKIVGKNEILRGVVYIQNGEKFLIK